MTFFDNKKLATLITLIFMCLFILTNCNHQSESSIQSRAFDKATKYYKINKMNSCEIGLSVDDTEISFGQNDEKNIDIVIFNKSNDTIYIPEWLYVGSKDDLDSEIFIEIEKWDTEKNEYNVFKGEFNHYDYITYGRKLKAIKPNDKFTINQNIEIVSNINKVGKYRLKVWLKLQNKIKCDKISTEWIEFRVI